MYLVTKPRLFFSELLHFTYKLKISYIHFTYTFYDGMVGRTRQDKSVGQYTHSESKRPNNPPVGLVTPGTDPDQPKKRYSYDPRLDPQLVWSGKQENTEFDVDTVSLHVHERIDPHTILEKAMKPKEHSQSTMHSFFDSVENNPPLRDAIEFYKHGQDWSNRLIAGDSLLVMNSLLEKEGMEGKVQMIYIDPPYGIKYGSNFQPFVNKKDVRDGKDEDLTQEPEMIKAFRDTWELGIHSYLSYFRDRSILAKRLLQDSGSCLVQISLENVSRLRLIMDEVFGADNFVSTITVKKTTSSTSKTLDSVADYLLWYAKDFKKIKYYDLFQKKELPINDFGYKHLELPDGTRRSMSRQEIVNPYAIPDGSKIFMYGDLTSAGGDGNVKFEFDNKSFFPRQGHWKVSINGLQELVSKKRIDRHGKGIGYIRYFDDFPYKHLDNIWTDATSGFLKKTYVVQTNSKIIERVMLMTTEPGDLVLDPTCGSGTTAYVAEKWGRRWITCDTSRIALALTKQRLMIASFDYFKLLKPNEGISSGFEYETVPHITLGSLANNENPMVETLYDKPIVDKTKTRVTGPFTVEAVPAPTVKSIDELSKEIKESKSKQNLGLSLQQQWRDELLKTGIRGKSGQKIEFSRVETHPATRWLHADAETKGENPKRVMISFGPEHAPLEQRQVELAIEEARDQAQKPAMIIFAAMQFDPEAAKDIDELKWPGITIFKAEMNKDLLTKDLKRKRSTNESFWLMGQPDVELEKSEDGKYTVSVNGFDYYNIINDEIDSGGSSKIAMWMLDTDYDGRSIYPQQVFFPMGNNGGWEKLAKTLRSQIDEELIAKYVGTKSIPFESGSNRRAAVKIVDDRGIESLKILDLG